MKTSQASPSTNGNTPATSAATDTNAPDLEAGGTTAATSNATDTNPRDLETRKSDISNIEAFRNKFSRFSTTGKPKSKEIPGGVPTELAPGQNYTQPGAFRINGISEATATETYDDGTYTVTGPSNTATRPSPAVPETPFDAYLVEARPVSESELESVVNEPPPDMEGETVVWYRNPQREDPMVWNERKPDEERAEEEINSA